MWWKLDVVQTLVAAGGQELLMPTSDEGKSCLHEAASEGHLEVVEALAAAGGAGASHADIG